MDLSFNVMVIREIIVRASRILTTMKFSSKSAN